MTISKIVVGVLLAVAIVLTVHYAFKNESSYTFEIHEKTGGCKGMITYQLILVLWKKKTHTQIANIKQRRAMIYSIQMELIALDYHFAFEASGAFEGEFPS